MRGKQTTINIAIALLLLTSAAFAAGSTATADTISYVYDGYSTFQSFKATSTKLESVKAYLDVEDGNYNITLSVQSLKNGTRVANKMLSSALLKDGWNEFIFTKAATLTIDNTYWIEIETQGVKTDGDPNVIVKGSKTDVYSSGEAETPYQPVQKTATSSTGACTSYPGSCGATAQTSMTCDSPGRYDWTAVTSGNVAFDYGGHAYIISVNGVTKHSSRSAGSNTFTGMGELSKGTTTPKITSSNNGYYPRWSKTVVTMESRCGKRVTSGDIAFETVYTTAHYATVAFPNTPSKNLGSGGVSYPGRLFDKSFGYSAFFAGNPAGVSAEHSFNAVNADIRYATEITFSASVARPWNSYHYAWNYRTGSWKNIGLYGSTFTGNEAKDYATFSSTKGYAKSRFTSNAPTSQKARVNELYLNKVKYFYNNIPTTIDATITGGTHIGATLEGYATYSDKDGDAEKDSKRKWYHNGVVVSTDLTLNTTEFMNGDSIQLEYMPCDDQGTCGTTIKSTELTLKTPRILVTGLKVTPKEPSLSDDLTCSFTATSKLSESMSVSVKWLVNNVEKYNETGNITNGTIAEFTLDSSLTSKGDEVKCSVKVSDEYAETSWYTTIGPLDEFDITFSDYSNKVNATLRADNKTFTLIVPSNIIIVNGTIWARGTPSLEEDYNITGLDSGPSIEFQGLLTSNKTAYITVPTNSTVKSTSLSIEGGSTQDVNGVHSGGSTYYGGVCTNYYSSATSGSNVQVLDGNYAHSAITWNANSYTCTRFDYKLKQPSVSLWSLDLKWVGYTTSGYFDGGSLWVYNHKSKKWENTNNWGHQSTTTQTTSITNNFSDYLKSDQMSWAACSKSGGSSPNFYTSVTYTDYAGITERHHTSWLTLENSTTTVSKNNPEKFTDALNEAISACDEFPCNITITAQSTDKDNMNITNIYAALHTLGGDYLKNTRFTIGATEHVHEGKLNTTIAMDFKDALQAKADACEETVCDVNITVSSDSYGGIELWNSIKYRVKDYTGALIGESPEAPLLPDEPDPPTPPCTDCTTPPEPRGPTGPSDTGVSVSYKRSGGGGAAVGENFVPSFQPKLFIYTGLDLDETMISKRISAWKLKALAHTTSAIRKGTTILRSYGYEQDLTAFTEDYVPTFTKIVDTITIGNNADSLSYVFTVPEAFVEEGIEVRTSKGEVTQLSDTEYLITTDSVEANEKITVDTIVDRDWLATDVEEMVIDSEKPWVYANEEAFMELTQPEPKEDEVSALTVAPIEAEPLPVEPEMQAADITGLLSFSLGDIKLGLAALAFVGMLSVIATRAKPKKKGGKK